METCKRHKRWTYIKNADGTEARRHCPECPRSTRQFLHMPTGRIMTPAMVREQDGRWTPNT
jgi:hypothetical protein